MPDALLLVGHGSRSPAGLSEMETLLELVREASPTDDVRLGYLELSQPSAAQVLDDLLAEGARDIVVVPLMLYSAGHSKSDIPALIARARTRHAGARIRYGRPFGADYDLLRLARRRIADVDALGLPLAVIARGTSDPDANAEVCRIARLIAEMTEAPLALAAFSGVTWPSLPEALRQLQLLNVERIAAFTWFIATGVLIDRVRDQYRTFSDTTGIEVVDAGYLVPGPEVASLVLARANEAVNGPVIVNCDTCAYRRSFPGIEDRVGAPIGVGHSHLAEEHRVAGRSNHAHYDHSHLPS